MKWWYSTNSICQNILEHEQLDDDSLNLKLKCKIWIMRYIILTNTLFQNVKAKLHAITTFATLNWHVKEIKCLIEKYGLVPSILSLMKVFSFTCTNIDFTCPKNPIKHNIDGTKHICQSHQLYLMQISQPVIIQLFQFFEMSEINVYLHLQI